MNTPTGQLAIKDIAALANVTRAAVSNWRSRYQDFPSPTPQSPARRPLFDLQEILSWLKANDLLAQDAATRSVEFSLKATINLLRASTLEPINSTFLTLYLLALHKQAATTTSDSWQSVADSSTTAQLHQAISDAPVPARHLPADAPAFVCEIITHLPETLAPDLINGFNSLEIEDYGQAATLTIDSILGLGGRGSSSEFGTSKSASSALLVNAAATTIKDGDTIFDPACGIGGTALSLSTRGTNLNVIGNDIELVSAFIATIHAYLADIPATFTHGDSLANDPHPGLSAQTIVTEPPLAMRLDREIQQSLLAEAGIDASTVFSEEAFVLYILSHLAPGGRGYVLTGMSTGYSGRSTQFRQALVARNALEAVVQLPQGLLSYSSIPTMLWVIQSPEHSQEASVLIADASEASQPEAHIGQWLTELRAGIDASIPTGKISLAELITNEGSLVPAQLLRKDRSSQEVHQELEQSSTQLHDVLELIHSAQSAEGEFFEHLPTAAAVSSLHQLIARKIISRQRPTRRLNAPDESPETGLQARQITSRHRGNEAKIVTVEKDTPLLQDGDIVLPRIGTSPAWVFTADGSRWVAPLGFLVLRVNNQAFDPHYLAACINASFNEAPQLGLPIARRELKQIQIPHLDIDQQREVARSLEKLNDLHNQAEELSKLTVKTMDAAINVIRYGSSSR
ncbi:N-6 DNA methylase [Corynebacterium alimapuense]|uniref:Restriction endonuclease subunit M n=1 Tax=Corynebacterium alimapuense TaxID=1576874 RepID=A0A3M8K4Q7_9CORY|nr:N-6 DNA methylase [Corynebacterium alimapuense]RNE48176.1 restriction endonuclease subunit M [Corynebacterium alimapuense]